MAMTALAGLALKIPASAQAMQENAIIFVFMFASVTLREIEVWSEYMRLESAISLTSDGANFQQAGRWCCENSHLSDFV
jgi:hypothetical protein